MTNQNGGDVHPVVASSPLTPDQHQQLLRERLRAYHDSMYCFSLNDYYSLETGASPSPSLSDLQSLESSFRRLDVTGVNACPQPLIDNCQSNQFPLNGRDRGMNGNEYSLPLNYQQEQSQRLLYPMDDCVNGYRAHKSYNHGFHGRSNNGVMSSSRTGFNGNLGNVPFSPSNLFVQSPWSYHDLYTMCSFRVTATTLSRAKDRGESQRLLKVIAEGSRKTIDKIFEDLVSQVCELMIDPIGHEVLQKLFEKCTDEQITRVLDIVIQQPIQFIRICGDSHGTHAIQDLMRCLGSDEQISRLMVTLCHVALVLTKSINANHVILFCFTHFSPSQNRYLLQVIAQNCYQVAIDQFGCCMLQQCIGKSYQEIRDPLIEKIITHSMSLCVNCYGNYVVQFVLELEDFHVAAALSKYFDGNYAQLSCDKYGSHAVQRCLTSRQFNSRKIVNELISDIDSLLVNPFGNYVIQTAWVVSQADMRNALLYHIKRNHPFMRCNRYGRKVLEKLNLWT
ncbi:pumilio homolog 15 [Eutrema salsugineum]|uniref:pumilio homolog 15 n=1 Tax=Eutrema salsugineum TaxID=72664 RepID=UPI000CED00E7|nr:pumilio homolog 15 [Eutrema salsugineum]